MPSEPKLLEHGRLLPEFVAARGIAALWIVAAHTLATVLQGHGGVPGAIEYTRIVVDFFFVQSGFVLAHIYDPQWRGGRFRYREFLARRLARLWPLHVATLLAVAALVAAGRFAGMAPENPHDAWSFVATLLMLHSAWTTSDLAWNWPSWSVSAEWIAYLAIPLFFLTADRINGTRARVLACLGVFAVFAAISDALIGRDLIELTFDGGALRIAPSFLAGILLRRMFEDEPALSAMTPRAYALVVAGVLGVSVALALWRAPYDALWPAMLALVAALAGRAMRAEPGLLRGRALAWLGELSYALYLTHAIVLMVVFSGAKFLGFADSLPHRILLGVASVAMTCVAAQAAYALVEKPGRTVMARLLLRQGPLTTIAAGRTAQT